MAYLAYDSINNKNINGYGFWYFGAQNSSGMYSWTPVSDKAISIIQYSTGEISFTVDNRYVESVSEITEVFSQLILLPS